MKCRTLWRLKSHQTTGQVDIDEHIHDVLGYNGENLCCIDPTGQPTGFQFGISPEILAPCNIAVTQKK